MEYFCGNVREARKLRFKLEIFLNILILLRNNEKRNQNKMYQDRKMCKCEYFHRFEFVESENR